MVRGIEKGTSQAEFQTYVNNIAGKPINFLYVKCISRDYSPWVTLALELSNEDYDILAEPCIWESNIQIQNFVGWRWWRSDRPKRLTPLEIKNLCVCNGTNRLLYLSTSNKFCV